MLTYFLLAGYRDNEAFDVLDKGSKKKGFDDHVRDDRLALMAVQELRMGRPLLWEEKANAFTGTTSDWGMYTRYREMARLITWRGIRAQRRGDHEQALLAYGGLMRTADLMEINSYTIFEALVANALGAIGRDGPAWAQRTRSNESQFRSIRHALARDYYDRHKRSDLVSRTDKAKAARAALQQRINVIMNGQSHFGAEPVSVIISNLLWRAGVMLLLTLLLPAGLWLLLGCFRRRIVLAPNQRALSPRAVALCLFLCAGMVLLSVLCDITSSALKNWDEDSGSLWGQGFEGVREWLLYSVPGRVLDMRWLAAAVPALIALVYCFGRAAQWQRTTYRGESSLWQQLRAAMRQGEAVGLLPQYDLRPMARLILEATLCVFFLAFWFAQGVWTDSDTLSVITAGVVIACGLYPIRAAWICFRLPARRAAMRYTLFTWRQMLGALVAGGSVLWLLLALISLPLRADIERNVDSTINNGELQAPGQAKK
jgi:hypothetical protein